MEPGFASVKKSQRQSAGSSTRGRSTGRIPKPAARPPVVSLSRLTSQPRIQTKLRIGAPNDRFEQEADRVADQVMRMPEPVVQRVCSECEEEAQLKRLPTPPDVQRMCSECAEEAVQAKAAPGATARIEPGVEASIRSLAGGRPLAAADRSFFEPRMGTDFSAVRVHTDSRAQSLATGLQARAFTHGRNVVFGRGEYAPASSRGRTLIAHELTHVVQQGGLTGSSPGSLLSRADRDATSRVLALGNTLGSGIRFWPTQVVDTVVGPTSARGGLLSRRANRLSVIVGENMTLRVLARILLPLWTTATPFTAPGSTSPVPLDIINEETLARALLAYNQYYLTVPRMINWRAGLRFPLPAKVNASGIATLHPALIRRLATGYKPAWAPLLDLRTTAITAPTAATLRADVTRFLTQTTTSFGRGLTLGARAGTNAAATLPFVRETFRQLGANGFDVALDFMNSRVNLQIELLAAQRDGAAIIGEIRAALRLAPATLSATQQASLRRANLMLGRVTANPATPVPSARRTRTEKTVTVDLLKLDGSNHNPTTDLAIANAIYSQCNIRIVAGVIRLATAAETIAWLGADRDLRTGRFCGSTTIEERRMWRGGQTTYGMSATIRAFFMADTRASGYSLPRYCATGAAAPFRGLAAIDNSGDTDTLAHEIGHILINHGSHPAQTVMAARPRTTLRLTDWQCNRAYANA